MPSVVRIATDEEEQWVELFLYNTYPITGIHLCPYEWPCPQAEPSYLAFYNP